MGKMLNAVLQATLEPATSGHLAFLSGDEPFTWKRPSFLSFPLKRPPSAIADLFVGHCVIRKPDKYRFTPLRKLATASKGWAIPLLLMGMGLLLTAYPCACLAASGGSASSGASSSEYFFSKLASSVLENLKGLKGPLITSLFLNFLLLLKKGLVKDPSPSPAAPGGTMGGSAGYLAPSGSGGTIHFAPVINVGMAGVSGWTGFLLFMAGLVVGVAGCYFLTAPTMECCHRRERFRAHCGCLMRMSSTLK